MKKKISKSRRNFLKTSAIGAAGISASMVMPKKAHAQTFEWSNRDPVNPAIDNLKVVCCYDPAMVKKDALEISNFPQMANQNSDTAVDRDAIRNNLDAMAKSLSGKTSVSEAWETIFQKDPTKNWNVLKVAIKVNCIAENHPRIAIVEKLCNVLNDLGGTGQGVPYTSIIVYDGCHNADNLYSDFAGTANLPSGYNGAYLPEGVVVSSYNDALGGMEMVDLPPPYDTYNSALCTKSIADGTINILINIACNKGHTIGSQCTLTMKNHFGTFTPNPPEGNDVEPYSHGNLDYVLSINKSDAILGGNPIRQQLCIIDSLWAKESGPGGSPDVNTYRLIMGTFGPAVDYLTVKEIREPIVGASHTANQVSRFLTEFGYETSEIDSLTAVDPASTKVSFNSSKNANRQIDISVTLDGSGYKVRSARLRVTAGANINSIDIFNSLGQKIRSLPASQQRGNSHRQVFWDGKNDTGSFAAAGTYLIAIPGMKQQTPAKLIVQKK